MGMGKARSIARFSPLGVLFVALMGIGASCEEHPNDPGSSEVDVELPGVETESLTPRERHEFSAYVRELPAPCSNLATPVSQCVLEKRACARCLPAARFVAKAVRDGMSREQVEQAYKHRFDASGIRNVPLDGSPVEGPENAPVVIVEFADFECPACERMAPVLDEAFAKHKTEVRLVYKFMPIAVHPHGEAAARAGIAAYLEGHFWEMHKKLFANRSRLEQTDLAGYAKEIGLDPQRFNADLTSPQTNDRLARDRKLADGLGVHQTPTIYVNGREYDFHGDIEDWVESELGK
jgi:protein-disulfide isomerase